MQQSFVYTLQDEDLDEAAEIDGQSMKESEIEAREASVGTDEETTSAAVLSKKPRKVNAFN